MSQNLGNFLDQLEAQLAGLNKTAGEHGSQGTQEETKDPNANKTQGQGTKPEVAGVVGNVNPASGTPAVAKTEQKVIGAQNPATGAQPTAATPNRDPQNVALSTENVGGALSEKVPAKKQEKMASRALHLATRLVQQTSAAVEKAASVAAPVAPVAEESLDKIASDAKAFVASLPVDAQEKIASAHNFAMEQYQNSFQAYLAQAHQYDIDIQALQGLGLSKQAAEEALAELAEKDPAALAPGAEEAAPAAPASGDAEAALAQHGIDPAQFSAIQQEIVAGLESGALTVEELVKFLEAQGVDVNQAMQALGTLGAA